jgi:O-methyltransferase involved in polyketide biosynthesis
MPHRDPARISPTAHYTAYVWYRNEASHPALATARGRLFYYALAPFNALSAAAQGGLTLERMLLQRHRIIDHLLNGAIEDGTVGQVVEVACGLSPRGLRTMQRFADRPLVYVEADLPEMAARKRRALEGAGLLRDGHHVVALDVLQDDGEHSLAALANGYLQPGLGTAIVTEGLVNYFDPATVDAMWARFGRVLTELGGGGLYLSDLHVEDEMPAGLLSRVFREGLQMMTRGARHAYHRDAAEAEEALHRAGFTRVRLHRPSELAHAVALPHLRRPDVLRVVEASLPASP